MVKIIKKNCKTRSFTFLGQVLTGYVVGYEWEDVEYCELVYVPVTNTVYRL